MSIQLTDAAAERVRGFLLEEPEALGLRFAVKKTGCSGWAYQIDLTRAVGEDDAVFDSQGIRVFVPKASLPLLDGTEIDFIRQGLGARFEFRNPNVKGECGCGESFTTA